jgi:hypothetical protein
MRISRPLNHALNLINVNRLLEFLLYKYTTAVDIEPTLVGSYSLFLLYRHTYLQPHMHYRACPSLPRPVGKSMGKRPEPLIKVSGVLNLVHVRRAVWLLRRPASKFQFGTRTCPKMHAKMSSCFRMFFRGVSSVLLYLKESP